MNYLTTLIVGVIFILLISFLWLHNTRYSLFDLPFLALLTGTFVLGRKFTILAFQIGSTPVFITEFMLTAFVMLALSKKRIINVFKRFPRGLGFVLFIYCGFGILYLFIGIMSAKGMIIFRDIVFCIYPLFILITMLTVSNVQRLKSFVSVMMPVAIISTAYGVCRYFNFGFLPEQMFSGTKSFQLALYYGFTVIFCVSFYSLVRKRKFLTILLLSISFSLIILSKVRTAWIATLFAILFLAIVLKGRTVGIFLRIFPAVFIGLILTVYIWQITAPQDLVLEARSILDWDMVSVPAYTMRWRFAVWKQMLQHGFESPLIGHGFGEQPDFLIGGRAVIWTGGAIPGLETHTPHNHILTIFFKMGFIGVFLFLYINLKIFLYGFHYLKRCKSEFNKSFLVACLGSFVCWHSTAFFFDAIESPTTNIFLWIILGLILSVIHIDKNENPSLS